LHEEPLLLRALPPGLVAQWRARGVEIRYGANRSFLSGESVFMVELLLVDLTKTFIVRKTGQTKQVRLGPMRRIDLRRTLGDPPVFTLQCYGDGKGLKVLTQPLSPEQFRVVVVEQAQKLTQVLST